MYIYIYCWFVIRAYSYYEHNIFRVEVGLYVSVHSFKFNGILYIIIFLNVRFINAKVDNASSMMYNSY